VVFPEMGDLASERGTGGLCTHGSGLELLSRDNVVATVDAVK